MSNAYEVIPESYSAVLPSSRNAGHRIAVTDVALRNVVSFAEDAPSDSAEVYIERKGPESYLGYR